jgi:hypothetical protein
LQLSAQSHDESIAKGLAGQARPFFLVGEVMSIESAEVEAAIIELVSAGTVQGTDLARQLREKFPDWKPASVGARSLRDFIDTNVEGVGVVGRSGLDVVYGSVDRQELPTTGAKVTSSEVGSLQHAANAWRVWVSPKSPLSLAVNRHTGDVASVARGASASDDLVVVEPPGQGVHKEIARQFIRDSAGLSSSDSLLAVVDGDDEHWWLRWNRELGDAGLLERWRGYRALAFENRLAEVLRDHGLGESLVASAVTSVRQQRSGSASTREAVGAVPSSGRGSDRAQLERVLGGVLSRMSVNELRSISVPVGLVFDALEAE